MSIHKKTSLVKSAVRLTGYLMGGAAFYQTDLSIFRASVLVVAAFAVLFLSEIVGIIEELGEK